VIIEFSVCRVLAKIYLAFKFNSFITVAAPSDRLNHAIATQF